MQNKKIPRLSPFAQTSVLSLRLMPPLHSSMLRHVGRV